MLVSKDHHFILLPGHILYRKPGGHKIVCTTHLKLRGQNIDPFMGSISFNPYRGQINHDLGHQNNPEKGRF